MFDALEKINERPAPFQVYTASELWTDDHTSQQMLAYHLDETLDVSSRNAAFIDQSVAWIATEFDVAAGARIADFGCGPGLYAARLAKRGARVTGIDFSARSIAYARQVAARDGLAIDYVHQDYLSFTTDDRFDLVLMIMCDFCALGPDQRSKILQTYHRILKPGGAVLLDVYSLSAFDRREEAATYEVNQLGGFWSPSRYYGFVNTFKYDAEKVVLDKYTIVEPARTRQVYNWLQHYCPETLERELVAAGFTLKGLYADVAGRPFDASAAEFAIVAVRAR